MSKHQQEQVSAHPHHYLHSHIAFFLFSENHMLSSQQISTHLSNLQQSASL